MKPSFLSNSKPFLRAILASILGFGLLAAGLQMSRHSIRYAAAQEPGVSLTVYNQNLALVKDVRTQTLKAGINELRFVDVAALIDPTSVLFRSLTDPEGTRILEQNYEYDLVGTDKLFSKYIDQKIRAITDDGTEYAGTLLSAAGDLIIQSEAGAVSIIKSDRLREVNFPSLPGGLITRPSLVWMVEAKRPGEHALEVTYLTNGVNWSADYVVELNKDDTAIDLNGWITLDNQSGATYENATLKLVAGEIHRAEEYGWGVGGGEMVMAKAMPAPQVTEREFFEYHIYEILRPVTVKNQQTKQIEFTSAKGVAAEKEFVFEGVPSFLRGGYGLITDPGFGLGYDTKVKVMLEFENREQAGLGIPLPQGRVRVYKADVDGSIQLVGEDRIGHTPKDEKVRLYLGNAFDIVAERTQTDFQVLGKDAIRESFRIEVRNHKSEDVKVRVVERLYRGREWEITAESAEHTKRDAFTVEWVLPVPKDGKAELTYSVTYRGT